MFLIASGFVAVFALSFWISGRVGARRQSAGLGMLAGLTSFVIMFLAYFAGLMLWVRAKLIAFVKTELPLMIDRLLELVDRVALIRDTI